MSWQTFLNGFAPGGNQGVQARQAGIDSEKQLTQWRRQQAAQQAEDFNVKALHQYLDEGDLPVGPGNQVMRPSYFPGNEEQGLPPSISTVRDTADPSRIYTHTSPDGHVFTFEKATPQDVTNKALYQHIADMANPAVRQARDYDNQNLQANERAKSGGQSMGRNDADVQKRETEGIPVPSAVDQYLPGLGGKKVLPSELDDIVRSAGSYADLTTKATNRGKPKVVRSELSRDDQGNQVQINSLDDGTVTEVPINAKGVTAKAPNGTSPYQQWQMNRNDANDAHARVKEWQDKLDKLQSQSEALWAEKKAADDELESLNQQLTARTTGILGTGVGSGPVLKGSERFQLQSKINGLKNKSTAAAAKATAIDQQKGQVDTVRRAIMKANGLDGSGTGGGAVTGAPGAGQEQGRVVAAPKTASMAQIKAYAAKSGKTVEQVMQEAKDQNIAVQ